MMNFSEEDLKQLSGKGISKEKVLEQVETFKEGIPFVRLNKAAIISEGILKFSEIEEKELIQQFEESIKGLSLLKFVPASGAASRMFKALFNFLDAYDSSKETLEAYIKRTKDKDIKVFFNGYENFAFYNIIQNAIEGKATSKDEEKYLFVKQMMLEDGFNYGFYPKGLLPFHNYGDYFATPFEKNNLL